MKNGILIVSLILNGALLGLYFMENTSQPQEEQTANKKSVAANRGTRSLAHREPLSNAVDSVQAYVDSFPDMVQAFTISSTDMLKVLGLNPIKYKDSCDFSSCRAYLGLGNSNNFKLYLTPVQDNKDYFWYGNDIRHLNASETVQDNSFVYDLIAPCPKTCDTGRSPLNIK